MNIVLVSMDGVRPDYLTHPFFTTMKNNGMNYSTCITQASHTSTSHSSILTGLSPFHHNVRWLVDYSVTGTMIQEQLKEHNYITAAFIGGFPLTEGNLDKGFDHFLYDETVDDRMEGRERFMPANVIVQRTVRWLNENKGKNSFSFLHFFDAHLMLRSEFGKNSWPQKDENGLFIDVEKHLGRRKKRYKEEVDFIGEQLQLLYDLADIDLLVVTADHGTKMQGEKRYPWVYNSKNQRVGTQFHVAELYDVQLKVPLMFYGPNIPTVQVSEMVRTIDIMPTILEYAGLSIPSLDGVSLLQKNYSEYAYAETYFAQLVESNRRACELNSRSWGWVDIDSLVCIRSNKYKLICLANNGLVPYELYDLEKDPQELTNCIKGTNYTDIGKQLVTVLQDTIGEDKQMYAESIRVGEEIKNRLQTLGYL